MALRGTNLTKSDVARGLMLLPEGVLRKDVAKLLGWSSIHMTNIGRRGGLTVRKRDGRYFARIAATL